MVVAALDTIADRQAKWSEAASNLKSTIDRARWSVFVLSVLGALTAAFASQMLPPAADTSLAGNPRTWVAIFSVVCLAAATFFTSRLLGAEHLNAWVRARAVAESLKREAYKFAAAAAPYDDPDRNKAATALEEERTAIEVNVSDLLSKLATKTVEGSAPRTPLTPDEYIKQRIDRQIGWYEEKADKYRRAATALRRIEFGLAFAATLVTAVASVTGKSAPFWGVQFDFAALTAVLTTIAAAVLAHVEASRFDFLVTIYLATADRLENRRNRLHHSWSDFVNDCENIISAENTSWIAKWTR